MTNQGDLFKNIDLNSLIKPIYPTFETQLIEQQKEMQKVADEVYKRKEEERQAIIETSKTNQQIVEQTQETNRQLEIANRSLQRANKGLEKINDSLERQLESVNNNISFVLQAIGANAQRSERLDIDTQKMLVEIQVLLVNKDEKGIKAFLENHSGDVISGVGLILQVISMMAGMGN